MRCWPVIVHRKAKGTVSSNTIMRRDEGVARHPTLKSFAIVRLMEWSDQN